jgi:hypothetical protein
VEAAPIAFADGVPTAGVGAAVDARPAEDAGAAAGAGGEEALADELPGKVGRGGGFAAGGGDAAGAGRAGGTVGMADFEVGLLMVAPRGAPLELAADGVAGRLVPGEPVGEVDEPGCDPEGVEWAADASDCAADALECSVRAADCDARERVDQVEGADCAAREPE